MGGKSDKPAPGIGTPAGLIGYALQQRLQKNSANMGGSGPQPKQKAQALPNRMGSFIGGGGGTMASGRPRSFM